MPTSPRTIIQQNRAVTLFLLYFLFLIGVDPSIMGINPLGWLCRTVAIFIHFFGLCSFSWTFLEGWQLYKALVHKKLSDDNGKYSNLIRYLVGYGVPLLIVTITLAVAYIVQEGSAYSHADDDGTEDALCWLEEGAFIYAFVGPAAVVILVNAAIL